MGKRNLVKLAEKIKEQHMKNKYLSCYDLNLDELCELTKLAREDPSKAVIVAFDAGMVIGSRAREKNRIPVL